MAVEITKIIEGLEDLGFRPEPLENDAYKFSFEGLNLIYDYDTDDTRFLRILAPGIYDVEDGSRSDVLEAVNDCNNRIKYGKVVLEGDSVWVMFEHYLTDEADIENVLRTSIIVTRTLVELFHRTIVEYVHTEEEDSEE